MRMAVDGLLACAVVISDPDYANSLKANCPWMTVVARQVWTDTDPSPIMNGDEDHDRQVARDWYRGPLHFHTQRCRPDVYVQLTNETSYPYDGYFQDELMNLADAEGHLLALPTDSGGAVGDSEGMTALWFSADGKAQSDFFISSRGIALRHMKRKGHLYSWHSYGNIKTGNWEPSYDVGAYPWYAGRGFQFLSLLPAHEQPDNIISEFAAGGSQFTESRGFDAFWDNYTRFEALALERNPVEMGHCRGVATWTWGAPGWPGQNLMQWVNQTAAAQRR